MFRVLVADDQVPDAGLSSENAVLQHYTQLYNSAFAAGFVFIYNLLTLLKSQSYVVDSANTRRSAMELVRSNSYDAIVLDLGWWTAQDTPEADRMTLGWSMAEEMKQHSPAQILMFSNRFYEDAELAKTAAEMGCLPVYKSYDDACARNLSVTLRWATHQKPLEQAIIERTKTFSFTMYRRLSTVLLGAIVVTVILLFAAVALAVLQKTQASVLSTVFGVVSTAVNGIIYKYVSEFRESSH